MNDDKKVKLGELPITYNDRTHYDDVDFTLRGLEVEGAWIAGWSTIISAMRELGIGQPSPEKPTQYEVNCKVQEALDRIQRILHELMPLKNINSDALSDALRELDQTIVP